MKMFELIVEKRDKKTKKNKDFAGAATLGNYITEPALREKSTSRHYLYIERHPQHEGIVPLASSPRTKP
jgi:hypothetical protein